MSRSKKDILETGAMLTRLTALLAQHSPPGLRDWTPAKGGNAWDCRADAESLRRISMTLHRWHELECGSDTGAIERNETTGKPYWVRSDSSRSSGYKPYPIPDRETGARKRLAAIMQRYPTLTAYVQTDPRGCALYILRPGDVPEGTTVDSCYSRGLAVYQ